MNNTKIIRVLETPIGDPADIKVYPEGRRCKLKSCRKVLSVYTPGPYCNTHKFIGVIEDDERSYIKMLKARRDSKRRYALAKGVAVLLLAAVVGGGCATLHQREWVGGCTYTYNLGEGNTPDVVCPIYRCHKDSRCCKEDWENVVGYQVTQNSCWDKKTESLFQCEDVKTVKEYF